MPDRSPVRRVVATIVVLAALVAGCAATAQPPTPQKSASPAEPVRITFAVYGPAPVTAAYTQIAADYSATHPDTIVRVQPYATHDEAMAAVSAQRQQGDPPDLFLMDHDDLSALAGADALRRVDDLLGERRVDFGDGYSRNGLEAFSADSALQCMPADVSPLVVYYNPTLIDLSTLALPGSNPVSQDDGWSLEEFTAAALQARRPGVRGVYIAPDIEQVAPFIWSGGGEIVDDLNQPTSLQLSEGSSATAMESLLELVRNPQLTFSQAALRRRTPLQRFKDGNLAMILGFRDLTPELRAQEGLNFDVMPMPKLSKGATVGTMSGLCISKDSANVERTADFLAYVVSDKSAETLAATGYAMPANLEVVNNGAFLQADQLPPHATVFATTLRNARPLPEAENWAAVRSETGRLLSALFYDPVILPLADRLKAIDQASMPIFDPKLAPDASPSPPPGAPTSPSP